MVEMIVCLSLMYILISAVAAMAYGSVTGGLSDLPVLYGVFWPIVLLAGLVWLFTVGIREVIRGIKSWNWHENS